MVMKINILKTTFFKFLVVGGLGTVVNIIVYGILIHLGFNYLVASLISFLVAVTSNYFLNESWTFKNKANHKSKSKKYIEFVGISSANLITNLLILYFTLWILNANPFIGEFAAQKASLIYNGDTIFYNKIIAQVAGIGFSTIFNYLGNKFVTFKEQPLNIL